MVAKIEKCVKIKSLGFLNNELFAAQKYSPSEKTLVPFVFRARVR
jgi:hypothetical protein